MRRERSWPGGATALPTASTGPPVTVGKLADRRLESAGSELDLVVSQAFADPDGDPLVHAAASWTGSGLQDLQLRQFPAEDCQPNCQPFLTK